MSKDNKGQFWALTKLAIYLWALVFVLDRWGLIAGLILFGVWTLWGVWKKRHWIEPQYHQLLYVIQKRLQKPKKKGKRR